MDRSYDGMRRPVIGNSKMTVSEKCNKYLVDYRDSESSQSERCSEVEKEVEKAKHRVLVRSGSLIQEVILFLNNSQLFSLLLTFSEHLTTFCCIHKITTDTMIIIKIVISKEGVTFRNFHPLHTLQTSIVVKLQTS